MSVRDMARHLERSKDWAKRFLERLSDRDMIATATATGVNVITICNYEEYQSKREYSATPSEQQPRQDRDRTATQNKEEKEIKEGKNNNYAFHGRVIKLNFKDLARWKSSYSALDLPALLQSRDDWLSDQTTEVQKKWFQSTSNWLANKNQESKKQDRHAAAPSMPVC